MHASWSRNAWWRLSDWILGWWDHMFESRMRFILPIRKTEITHRQAALVAKRLESMRQIRYWGAWKNAACLFLWIPKSQVCFLECQKKRIRTTKIPSRSTFWEVKMSSTIYFGRWSLFHAPSRPIRALPSSFPYPMLLATVTPATLQTVWLLVGALPLQVERFHDTYIHQEEQMGSFEAKFNDSLEFIIIVIRGALATALGYPECTSIPCLWTKTRFLA